MTTMISEAYTAFIKADVPEEDARHAAQALSAESLATKNDIPESKHELAVMKWMLSVVIAAQVLPLLKSIGILKTGYRGGHRSG